MDREPSIIERAYDLAKSGECLGTSDVRDKLKAEGFEGVRLHISGPTLVADLTRLCRAARAVQPVDK